MRNYIIVDNINTQYTSTQCFYKKYINSDKSDLFTNLLKAATERTSA